MGHRDFEREIFKRLPARHWDYYFYLKIVKKTITTNHPTRTTTATSDITDHVTTHRVNFFVFFQIYPDPYRTADPYAIVRLIISKDSLQRFLNSFSNLVTILLIATVIVLYRYKLRTPTSTVERMLLIKIQRNQWRSQMGRGPGTPKEGSCNKKRKLYFIPQTNFYNHPTNFTEFALKIFSPVQLGSPLKIKSWVRHWAWLSDTPLPCFHSINDSATPSTEYCIHPVGASN